MLTSTHILVSHEESGYARLASFTGLSTVQFLTTSELYYLLSLIFCSGFFLREIFSDMDLLHTA